MKDSYINENRDSYEKKYSDGWGNRYPDTNMISIYYNIIKENIKENKPKVLDFGCSLGANSVFFKNIGYEVYGIDISPIAIKRCIELNNFNPDNFAAADVINGNNRLSDIFNVKFDLVIASECLYYFSDTDINNVLNQFKTVMKDSGILYISMVTYNHPSYRHLENRVKKDGLILVPQTGTMNEPLYVNLVKDSVDLENKLSLIKKLTICRSTLTLNSESEILYFIGKK